MESANQLQARGLSKFAAIREANFPDQAATSPHDLSRYHLWPFPLVLPTGSGTAARNSIGMMLVTGKTVGTIFTLFVVPAFYSLIAAQHHLAQSGAALEDVKSGKLTLAGTRSY